MVPAKKLTHEGSLSALRNNTIRPDPKAIVTDFQGLDEGVCPSSATGRSGGGRSLVSSNLHAPRNLAAPGDGRGPGASTPGAFPECARPRAQERPAAEGRWQVSTFTPRRALLRPGTGAVRGRYADVPGGGGGFHGRRAPEFPKENRATPVFSSCRGHPADEAAAAFLDGPGRSSNIFMQQKSISNE
jgi:hypothetical protein